ncbi:MAG: polymerase subunit sigma-24 [Lacunisphaera sp.]|jgi:RNA polymerase sigma-70 factor (ECF subfamily)|nr:polymerase subunit sigma-24 [Lacunisphaera sp.]
MFHFTHTKNANARPGFASVAAQDADLVRRFNSGDETAFAEIMERYRAHVLALVRRSLNNDHDAEDITQDTFIRAHRGLANFRGESALSTWLFRIALNLARNRYWYFFRRQRHNTISLDQPITENQSYGLTEVMAADSPSPLRQAMHNEFVDLVAHCLDRLEGPYREILRMRYIRHYSYEEIGEALHINFGTVKSRVARAREKLRKLILEAAPEFGRQAEMEDFFEPFRDATATATPA